MRRLRSANIYDSVHLHADSVFDLLMKRESAGYERLTVEPDCEAIRGEVGVEPPNEGLIIGSGVGQKNGSHDSNFGRQNKMLDGVANALQLGRELPVYPVKDGTGVDIDRIVVLGTVVVE